MSFFAAFDSWIERLKAKDRSEAKLGSFSGVFLPGILSVFGVITFLRLPTIVGYLGAYYFSWVLILGILINLLTAFSISSTVTNMNFKTGGVYTLLSRCFGAELGIAVSLPLYFSQAINISFCVIGLMEIMGGMIDPAYRLMCGFLMVAFLYFLTFLPAIAVRSLQLSVFAILILALFYVFFSLDAPVEALSQPIVKKPFWVVFALFYPAITGFESGLFSIDKLKEQRKTFPFGTIATVMVSFVIYLVFSFFLSASIDQHQLVLQDKILLKLVNPSWILYLAIIGSTILYALGCYLNAPKLLQAMGKDALFPESLWRFIQGAKEEPFSLLMTSTLALFFFALFDLDLLSPLLTQFFLLSYAMINLACFIEAFIQNPSWRPTFFVHYFYPLLGFLLCFISMVMIDPFWTVLSWGFVLMIYLGMRVKHFSQNFDDVRQSMLLYLTRFAAYRLSCFNTKSFRSWRPQLICFSQNLTQMTSTMRLAKALTQDKGFLILASSLKKGTDDEKIPELKRMIRDFFVKHEVHAIVELIAGHSIDELVYQMIHGYGLGPIKPNTMLFSYNLDRGSLHNFEVWMKEVDAGQKNGLILCYRDQFEMHEYRQFSFIKAQKRKKIEIVIQSESKEKQYFLFVLASLLQKSEEFFHSQVILRVLCDHEEAAHSILDYYKDFCSSKRFDFDVVVSIDEKNREYFPNLILRSYEDFNSQTPLANEMAKKGCETLFVYQREKLAFDQLLD